MSFAVLLTDDALRDLEGVDDYIVAHDGPGKVEYVLGEIRDALLGLGDMPERGTFPKELLALGLKEYREIFFQPYRIIYRVFEKQVLIYIIADGRRDMESLLARRLLG